MKKVLLIFTCAILVMSLMLTSCKGNKLDGSVDACAKDVISLMDKMLRSEEYLGVYNLTSAYADTLNILKNGNYSSPSAVYSISIPDESLADALSLNASDVSKMPSELSNYINSSAATSCVSRVNQVAGSTSIVVSSALSAQKVFVCEDIKYTIILLYTFENGCPIVVTFIPGESGAVRAVGQFIINADFNTNSERQIEESFAVAGIRNVEAKKK